eukprot:11988905-Karenia_brevis.AAC.1
MQGDASSSSKGGWTFRIHDQERIRATASATALAEHLSPSSKAAYRLGLDPEYVRERMLRYDSVFKVAEPEQLMEQSWNTSRVKENESTRTANTLTYAQRKKMQSREK